MDSRPPNLLLVLLITSFLHVAQCAIGHPSYIIDDVGLKILPSIRVQSGTPVTIRCQVNVSHDNIRNLMQNFQLRRDDIVIYASTTTEDSVTYEINTARATDSGSYDCQVTVKEKKRASSIWKLNVTGLQTPILYLNKTTLYEGDDFIATCSAPEEKGSLIFRFFQSFGNKEPLKMKQVASTGNSSETMLVLGQAGNYSLYCDYEISLVSETRRSNCSNEIQVEVKGLNISLELIVLPKFNIFEGDIVEANCKAVTSLTNVEVFLTKDKRILKKAIVGLNHQFAAQEEGSGKLVCKAEWGNVQKETYKEVIVKELFSTPRLTMEPVDLFEGDHLKLTCSVSVYAPERINNKTMQFSIYKNNVKLSNSHTYISVSHSDGNYTCKVQNVFLVHNFTKESETLIVETKVPVSEPVLSVVGGTLVLEKSFQVLCHCDRGTLPITYTLFGPNDLKAQKVVSKPGEQAIFNSLAISKISDLDKFICHARNSHYRPPIVGSGRQLLHSTNIIEPVSKPVLTITPNMGEVSEGQDVNLICSVEKGTVPIVFTWYHTEMEVAPLASQSSMKLNYSHSIHNVRAEHKGGYYCVSTNQAKETKQSYTVTIRVRLAVWKKGLIAVLCILLILALILAIALKKKPLLHFKRKRTNKLSVKSASTKVERLSLTQAEVNEAANVTPGMMGKSVWSEHVSGSESDDHISVTATEPEYKEVKTRPADSNGAPVENTVHNVRNSKQGVPEQADGGSVEYAQLNHDTDHHDDHDDHDDHGEHGDQCVQDDHMDESVDTNNADHGE